MLTSLSHSVDKISVINNKIESENKFFDNFRSMIASLSCLIDDMSEINKKILLIELSEKFHNTCILCNKDLNKFALLLRKFVYPYEYMDSWEKFNEEPILNKEYFHSNLNKEDIGEEDHKHAQKILKKVNIKNWGEYHDLYVQSDTTLLADVFENFRDKCLEIYEPDPAHFLSAPGLAWQACLRKTGAKLELLTDNDMLMTVEEGIRGGMCNAIHRYAKANNNYIKNYNKNTKSSY